MAEQKYSLATDGALMISASAAEKLISSADGNASLLYIYLMKNHGEVSLSKAAFDLKLSQADAESAFSLLISMGLVNARDDTPAEPPAVEELPSYNAEDIKNELENGAVFPALVSEVQNSLGKILSSDDLMKLFGIYDSLGLPPEVILTLINHCVAEYNDRYGGGRRPTMRYIEKTAYSWERNGIFTLELAEEYIKRSGALRDRTKAIAAVLNITDRPLTASERKYVESWADMGFPPETVEIAYDRTVLRTGKLSWSYLNSILKSWYSKKLITPQEVMNENKKPAVTPAAGSRRAQGEQPSVTAEDIRRMKRLIDDMNNEQEEK